MIDFDFIRINYKGSQSLFREIDHILSSKIVIREEIKDIAD